MYAVSRSDPLESAFSKAQNRSQISTCTNVYWFTAESTWQTPFFAQLSKIRNDGSLLSVQYRGNILIAQVELPVCRFARK